MAKKERKYEWVEPVAGRIARFFIGLQVRITTAMNKGVAGWSKKTLTFSLVIFCLLAGGSSLLIVGKGLFAKAADKKALKIDRIKVLPRMDEPDAASKAEEEKWERELSAKLRKYREVMDSLGEPGSPGLQDSIKELENLIK